MMGAQPCNRGQLANRKIVRQMRFDIVDYPVKTGRTQAAAHGHRGRAAVGILAKQMDNRCLGQPLDKEPATGTTADQIISPSGKGVTNVRSEEQTSELQSLMRISYAVFCLKKNIESEQYNSTEI